MQATQSAPTGSGGSCSVLDMSSHCRVCLQAPEKAQLLDLTTIYDEDDQLTYCDCFRICTQIDLRVGVNDPLGLPQNLCKLCGLELQMAYDFYKKVEDSKRSLRELHEQGAKQQLELESRLEAEPVQEHQVKHQTMARKRTLSSQECAVKEEPSVLDEMMAECDVMEEHLDMEEYHTMDDVDEDDAETIQIKIDLNENAAESEEEYTIEAMPMDEQQDVEQLSQIYNYSEASSGGGGEVDEDNNNEGEEDEEEEEVHEVAYSEMSWQQAVVTVANESHLPLKSCDDNNDDDDEEQLQEDVRTKQFQVEIEESVSNSCKATTTTNISKTPNPRNETAERKRYTGKYSCDFCAKEFPNYSRMAVHRRMHEDDRPKWSCNDCGRLYATKQAMDVHIRSVHTKTAGHICPICQKIYAIKKGLEIHMRYHNGDFPFVCDLCGKKFAQMSHLNTHKNVKHNSVRFCCEHPNCGKFFTSSASLRNHEFTHGQMPFECEFCQRGYPAKSKLKVHIKLKHGQIMTLEQMEHMRKFHVKRSKLNLVKVVECED